MMNEQTMAIHDQACTAENLGDSITTCTVTTYSPTDEPHPEYETISQYEKSDRSQISSSQMEVLDSE